MYIVVLIVDRRRAFSWGRADYGQLGRGDEVVVCGYSSQPDKVQELSDVIQVTQRLFRVKNSWNP